MFWITLLASGALTALVLLWFAHWQRVRLPWLHQGLIGLARPRVAGLTTTMGGTLLATSAWALFLWIVVVAPAVYGNADALQAIKGAEKALNENHFRANLVVTGSLLQDKECGTDSEKPTLRQGGVYLCFGGYEGCDSHQREDWRVFNGSAPERALEAVFASGSAFPVFPPHRAAVGNQCEVAMVDGGFAHNVPLEAAELAHARQVLILNASPDPADSLSAGGSSSGVAASWKRLEGSPLVWNSPRLLAFMFQQAQALDRNAASSMVVASLSPRSSERSWPFMLDFRERVRTRMKETARSDYRDRRRMGRVLSWGQPIRFMTFGSDPAQLPRPGGVAALHRVSTAR